MCRRYENPYRLEEHLAKLKERRANATDEDEIMSLDEDIAELKELINFAWQDDEYDEFG